MRAFYLATPSLVMLAALAAAQDSAPDSRQERPAFQIWADRHQDRDGSWSPENFGLHCNQEGLPLCTGRGMEGFRVAATSLTALGYVNAGVRLAPGSSEPFPGAPRAIAYVLAQQKADGGFAEDRTADRVMTNACATILVTRSLVLLKRNQETVIEAKRGADSRTSSLSDVARAASVAVRRIGADQRADGSWGEDGERTLSATVWSMLALRAGATAGIEWNSDSLRRGRESVEKGVAAIQQSQLSSGASNVDLARARALRAVARAATGAPLPLLEDDIGWLLSEMRAGGAVQDAEVLLFGTLAAQRLGGSRWDEWRAKSKPHIVESQEVDGCQAGSFSTPSVWWKVGGRVTSTALMILALEVYYSYPMALWL